MNFLTEFQHIAMSMQNDIVVFVALMGLDIITGIIKGTKGHTLSSAIMNLGIRKKSGYFFAIVFAMVMDVMMFNNTPTFTTMMTLLAVANEGLSVIENLAQLGVPIPEVIKKRLQVLKDQNNIEE